MRLVRFFPYAVALAALVVAGWLLVRYGNENVSRVLSDRMPVHVDFASFHDSAAALWHGHDLYRTGALVRNLDPPLWTVLIAPFGLLPPLVAYRIFAAVTAAAVLGGCALVARRLGLRWWVTVGTLVLFAVSSPLLGTVALGQVYGVLALCLVGSWLADQRGDQRTAGLLLGVVLALKPTLAPLLLLPVMRRTWPMLWWTIGGGAGATLLAALVAGPGQTVRWIGVVLAEPFSTFGDNASLPSTIGRLGGPVWLGYLLGAVAVLVTLRRIRRGGPSGLWALVAAALLMAPVAWHNYLVLCLPGVLVLLAQRRFAVAAPLLCLPLIDVDWSLLWPGRTFGDHLGQSLYCGILLTYWLVLLPREREQDQPERAQDEGWLLVGSSQPSS